MSGGIINTSMKDGGVRVDAACADMRLRRGEDGGRMPEKPKSGIKNAAPPV
jgi:hypothetical protein